MADKICPCCGCYHDSNICDCCGYDGEWETGPEPTQKKPTLEELLSEIYDLHKDPSQNKQALDQKLKLYKEMTGNDKPGFLP